jgi:hypothetical protein
MEWMNGVHIYRERGLPTVARITDITVPLYNVPIPSCREMVISAENKPKISKMSNK